MMDYINLVNLVNLLITICSFSLVIFILVSIHEFGHYIVAKKCGVKVLKFSVGFGPKLLSWHNKSGTNFLLSLIPLGGYVKMLDEREAEVAPHELPYAFNRKPAWQKLIVVLAGPIFNFILAFVAFYFMFLSGITVEKPVIQYVEPGSAAYNAGVRANQEVLQIDNTNISSIEDLQIALANRLGNTGDILLKTSDFTTKAGSTDKSDTHQFSINISKFTADINNQPIARSLGIWMVPKDNFALLIESLEINNKNYNFIQKPDLASLTKGDIITKFGTSSFDTYNSFVNYIKNNPGKSINITVLRNGEYQNLKVTIGTVTDKVTNTDIGKLGIIFRYPLHFEKYSYNLWESLTHASSKTVHYINQTFYMMYKLIVGDIGVETIRGPVMVAKAASIQIQIGISNFLNLLGVISIGLGIINLLPIPILDGGHAVYHTYEMITKKQVSESAEKIGMIIGLLFLGCIMTLAFYNDIVYW